ncbi:mitochondrial translation protein [Penicillium chermesinum]|uniref:Mitochondrial translation protein n=1 Tax=Penicillium chermesinum TaxID=63820 RepID=A0A9W9PKA6_9EURO|nr:mitochondrial translation protein [Penicillium chermesinum]KAJ5248981.1 mitochondrial translation protein [Penicillium chermesinum]
MFRTALKASNPLRANFHHVPILRSDSNATAPTSDKTPVGAADNAETPAQDQLKPAAREKETIIDAAPVADESSSDPPPSDTPRAKQATKAKNKPPKKKKKKGTPAAGPAPKRVPGPARPAQKPVAKANSSENNAETVSTPHDSRRGIQKVTDILRRKGAEKGYDDRQNGVIGAKDQELTALDLPEFPTAPVPGLAYGLDRVLFNPGVYHLRDPRSRVYNFDPYLGSIMPVDEFDFDLLKEYITSSKDKTLKDLAVQVDKKYRGSSSSMTAVLAHFHFLLSAWRPVDTRMLSQGFQENLRSFARFLRAPAAVFLHYKDGKYAVDADKEYDTGNILMELGKSMEKLLTMPKEEFERYRRSHKNKVSAEEEEAIPESYHYSTIGNFAMRSQLDAYDPRLPGTGMFDLKTRAVSSIRADARNFEHGLGYEIRSQFGLYESYEREYFDMIRAAFLKYSLQVRIGRMNGIFVAHHNIERIFGFQYISLSEMDLALHGQADTSLGDREFQLSMDLWSKVMDKATARFPEQTLRLHFETRPAKPDFMYIFAEPVTDAQIEEIQRKSKTELEAYRKRILNIESSKSDQKSTAPAPPKPSDSESDEMEEWDEMATAAQPEPKNTDANGPVYGMVLSIQNVVNGIHLERPNLLREKDTWDVEYELCDMVDSHARSVYKEVRERRRKDLDKGETDAVAANAFHNSRLRAIAKKGQEFRKIQDMLDEKEGIIVFESLSNKKD